MDRDRFAVAAAAGDVTSTIVAAANAFLSTLGAGARSSIEFAWTDTAQKRRWSNFPHGVFQRAGLMWGNMTAAQQAWLALVAATLSSEGYDRVMKEWAAEDSLAARHAGGREGKRRPSFGTAYSFVALIGAPSTTSPWQWQWGGHHVTLNATIAGGDVALTPSFIGAEPASYADADGRTVRPLGDIEDDAFTLVHALDAAQRAQAVLGDTPIDLVLGSGQDDGTLPPEGLPASAMSTDQQARFLTLIGPYVNLVNAQAAARRMADVRSRLADTYFAWYGPTTTGSPAYFRVTGPTVVIEYAPQGGGHHIHSIYRDPTNDYGAALVKA